MKKRSIFRYLILILLFFSLFSFSSIEAKKKVEWVGREISNFTLPSSHDRAITYAEEYYGKYHLVITFFPAAFTPL